MSQLGSPAYARPAEAQKEVLDSVKGLPSAMSRETAEAMITGGSNRCEKAWRSPR
jgi:hypothetical protein